MEWSGLQDSRGIATGRLAAAAEDSDSDMELSGAPSPSSSDDDSPRQKKRKPSAGEGTSNVDPPWTQASERPWSLWPRQSRAAASSSSNWWGDRWSGWAADWVAAEWQAWWEEPGAAEWAAKGGWQGRPQGRGSDWRER